MTIRAVILTHNEADFIEGCIASILPLTEDVLVLDSGSTDGTRELAAAMGVRVVERAWEGFSIQRNAALDMACDVDWVLFVDADERLTPALRDEISQALIVVRPDVGGLHIPRRNIICGRKMSGAGWWPDFQLRLLRPGRCRYDPRSTVHEVPECEGPTYALITPMMHLGNISWIDFAWKQIVYARLASMPDARPARRRYLGAPWREFKSRFIDQHGYRDGVVGFLASFLVAASRSYEVWLARKALVA